MTFFVNSQHFIKQCNWIIVINNRKIRIIIRVRINIINSSTSRFFKSILKKTQRKCPGGSIAFIPIQILFALYFAELFASQIINITSLLSFNTFILLFTAALIYLFTDNSVNKQNSKIFFLKKSILKKIQVCYQTENIARRPHHGYNC